ncbi:MAG: HAMP domain-containing histidine kinase [Turicibacter sp.]|nr:HAMP domain-containing histidine kinase [Turicibacter sp.]
MRISIKRRLLISNILMVVIPIILTFVFIFGATFILLGDFGMDALASLVPEIPIEQASPFDVDFSDVAFPETETVLVYQLTSGNYVLILPEEMNDRFEGVNWQDENMRTDIAVFPGELIDRLAVFSEQTILNVLVIIILVVFVFLTNHFLMRFVFKPILTSLNVLTEGVHEISVGNLGYRLKHDMGNEFDDVGVDFNEMALQLQEMVEQRKVAEKNRKELIAGISHDLRTPLTSIRTYAEGIELGMAITPEKQAQYLNTIKQKTIDIEHIINQLFLFSKLDIGEFPMRLEKQPIDKWLLDFVQAVREEYSEKGLRVELRENTAFEHVLADSVQLKNVLINLLENSVKYGNKQNGQLIIEAMHKNDHVNITLTDNGPGVSEEDLVHLFDVFYRSDKARTNPGGGSGLGLAISAKMIERMGGVISARNADNGGLQIEINLPVVKGES